MLRLRRDIPAERCGVAMRVPRPLEVRSRAPATRLSGAPATVTGCAVLGPFRKTSGKDYAELQRSATQRKKPESSSFVLGRTTNYPPFFLPVIWHQKVRQDWQRDERVRFGQNAFKRRVFFFLKQCQPGHRSIEYVEAHSARTSSRATGHAARRPLTSGPRQLNELRTRFFSAVPDSHNGNPSGVAPFLFK